MLCSDIMKTDVATCWIYDPIANVAARMRSRDVGFLPAFRSTALAWKLRRT